jgi:hypothetical protein
LISWRFPFLFSVHISVHPKLLDQLTRLWDDRELTIQRIARRLGMGTNGVGIMHQVYRLDLHLSLRPHKLRHRCEDCPRSTQSERDLQAINRRDELRSAWLHVMAEHPGLSISKLENLSIETNRLFTRLRNNDPEWLYANTPRARHPGTSGRAVDWEARDRLLAHLIYQAAEGIRHSDPPVPVTKASLARWLRTTAQLDFRVRESTLRRTARTDGHLPLTAAAVAAVVESRSQFYARKRQAAVPNASSGRATGTLPTTGGKLRHKTTQRNSTFPPRLGTSLVPGGARADRIASRLPG